MNLEKLTLKSLRVRGVNVPMARPLQTSGGAVASAPFVLIDLETAEGPVGHSYVFCYAARLLAPLMSLVRGLEEMVRGDRVAPLALEEKLQAAFRLAGPVGLAGWAMAGLDMAAWDALARAAGLPLARLVGGECRPVPAYNSCGLGIISSSDGEAGITARAATEAAELAAEGLAGLKVRLGYADAEGDAAVVRAVREAVPAGTPLMSDYNQSLTVPEAQQRFHRLRGEGLVWIEEPTRWDDYAGHAQIRIKAGVPVQLGENCWGPHDMEKAMAAGACDYFMPDLGKIGGVTGWLRAAALAEPAGLPISSHLFPEVSAHMLAVTPTRHWLEYVDWANPILAEPLRFQEGCAVPSELPGSGVQWNEEGIARHLVE